MGSSSNNIISYVVVVMAALSLFSMLCMFQIDKIVRMDLHNYGVRFSDQWTLPYMTMTKFVFLFGWMNIAAAISVHMYTLVIKRREVQQPAKAAEKEPSKKETPIPASEKTEIKEPAGEKPTNETPVEKTTTDQSLRKPLAEKSTDQKDTVDEKNTDETTAEKKATEEPAAKESTDEKEPAAETPVEEEPLIQPIHEPIVVFEIPPEE